MSDTPSPPTAGNVAAQLQFHEHLNQDVWDGTEMRPEVRLRLLRAAMSFYRFLDVPDLAIRDIVVTGSNAAFNYTELSDIDVHLVTDFASSSCPDLAENLFTTKKSLWGKTYEVSVRGHPVELYVEDAAHPAKSNGLYSILEGMWRREPSPVAPTRHDGAVTRKTENIAKAIENLLAGDPDSDAIRAMTNKLRTLRQNGLLKGGEFSTENLTYKALRSLGWLDRLWDAGVARVETSLSLP